MASRTAVPTRDTRQPWPPQSTRSRRHSGRAIGAVGAAIPTLEAAAGRGHGDGVFNLDAHVRHVVEAPLWVLLQAPLEQPRHRRGRRRAGVAATQIATIMSGAVSPATTVPFPSTSQRARSQTTRCPCACLSAWPRACSGLMYARRAENRYRRVFRRALVIVGRLRQIRRIAGRDRLRQAEMRTLTMPSAHSHVRRLQVAWRIPGRVRPRAPRRFVARS